MAITIRDKANPANVAAVDADGALRTATRGTPLPAVSGAVTAGGTGTLGPVDVLHAGNVSFIVKNTAAGTGWTGSPVIAFEQSDDAVSWTPLVTVRSDTSQVLSTHVLGPGAANTSMVFDAALEGVAWVRARVLTGTATGGLTVIVQPGGLPFTPTLALSPPQRTAVVLYGTALAVGTTNVDRLLTLSLQRGNAVVTTGTSYVIPAGKKLKVQALLFTQVGNTTATAASSVFRWRYEPDGSVTTASTPILLQTRLASPATSLSFQQFNVPLAEGYEIAGDGVAGFGFTVTPTYTTNAPTVDVQLIGYEY